MPTEPSIELILLFVNNIFIIYLVKHCLKFRIEVWKEQIGRLRKWRC